MASLVKSVLIPLRNIVHSPVEVTTTPTHVHPARPPALLCRWVLDDRTGRPVATWVAEPEVAEHVLTASIDQAVA
jgi:hypothetical protein